MATRLPLLPLLWIAVAAVSAAALRWLGLDWPAALSRGMAAGFLVVLLMGVATLLIGRLYRATPVCKNGCCREKDFELVDFREPDPAGDVELHYRCACGVHWLHRGRIFYEVREDGRRVPYRKWVGLWWVAVPESKDG
ncbi:MAG: hypothetical protein HY343_05330 [Lentisphaerae bacterium]|nr:hypothetical protein [Lentisphaerota bacterium]